MNRNSREFNATLSDQRFHTVHSPLLQRISLDRLIVTDHKVLTAHCLDYHRASTAFAAIVLVVHVCYILREDFELSRALSKSIPWDTARRASAMETGFLLDAVFETRCIIALLEARNDDPTTVEPLRIKDPLSVTYASDYVDLLLEIYYWTTSCKVKALQVTDKIRVV